MNPRTHAMPYHQRSRGRSTQSSAQCRRYRRQGEEKEVQNPHRRSEQTNSFDSVPLPSSAVKTYRRVSVLTTIALTEIFGCKAPAGSSAVENLISGGPGEKKKEGQGQARVVRQTREGDQCGSPSTYTLQTFHLS